jgi:hypothetical protein
LTFPVLADLGHIVGDEFQNPFLFIRIEDASEVETNILTIDNHRISELLACAASSNQDQRKWATYSLIRLYQLGLLGESWSSDLGDVLWAQLDSSGFPDHTLFFKFVFLSLPHPPSIVPEILLKQFIQVSSFPIEKNSASSGISISGGRAPFCNESVGASKYVQWDDQEIDSILNRLTQWWDTDKELLKKDSDISFFSSIPDEMMGRFSHLVNVLVKVIAPAVSEKTNNDMRLSVKYLLTDLTEYGVPSLQAKTAFLHLFPDDKIKSLNMMEDVLGSNDNHKIIDVFRAILVLSQKPKSLMRKSESSRLLNSLGQQIRWRRKVSLKSALDTVCILVSDHPIWFSPELEALMLQGLNNIADDVDLDAGSNDFDFSEKLEIRQAAAGLAYTVFEHCLAQDKPIPDVLNKWKGICDSEDEFAEIRNQWKE